MMPVYPTAVGMERKLAAILSADVQGYSRLMGDDEEATIRTLTASREITDSLIHQHRGRVVNTAGDSVLAEFASAVDAVQCAVDIQQALKAKNADLPPARQMAFRIGINVGDIVPQGEDLYGDGVNVAARLQALADAGGVFIAGTVYDQVRNKLALSYEYLGEQAVKNIAAPVRVWRVRWEESESQKAKDSANQKAKGKRQKAKIENRMATAHHARTALIIIGLLIIVGIVSFPFFPPLITHHSSLITEEAQPPLLPLPDKPSIAVLPFVNLSGDLEQEYFSDGMTEDLITDLSKISGLFVIARTSVFFYKGKLVKVGDVSKELGVRYVLEGSVRRADNQVRITAQLIDATIGHQLWAERYDRPLRDIFALQDEIRQKIVAALEVKLTERDQERLVRKYTDNLEAHDYYWRGREHYLRNTKEAYAQARQMYERALKLDPTYAEPYVGLGRISWMEWVYQWSRDPQSLERAFELAQKALVLNDSLPEAHQLLGWIYLWKNRQYEQAIVEGEKAIALNSNNADSYYALAHILNFAGRPEEAIGLEKKALLFNPYCPFGNLLELGRAYHLTGQYEEAITILKRALIRSPNAWLIHSELAIIYSGLGREEEARTEAAEVLRLNSNFSLEMWRKSSPVKDPAVLERQIAALRKAGLK
jgi:adenylate cyclase